MLFDENTVGGLRSVLDSAAQRTAGAIEGSRNVVERAKLRASLNDAYRKLGKAEYEAAVNGVSSMNEINGLIQSITDLRQQMLSAERSLQKTGTITCPTCGKLNSTEDSFCPGCGTRIK